MLDVKIPPLKEYEKFENLCLDLWKRIVRDKHLQKNGRPGQRQNGVDIFGRKDGTMNWVGIQCKVKSAGERLTEAEVEEEIRKASNFNPQLSEYIVVTTASRDQRLQEFVRAKTAEHINRRLFPIHVVFWDDIELELAREDNLDIYYRYYRGFFIDVNSLGNAIGKLVTIEIGIGGSHDTKYEILIGRTPRRDKDEDGSGIGYFKDSYYIVNLNAKTFDTFPVPCYPLDLEHVFRDERDAYIVSKWLNGLKLEDLIYGGEVKYESAVSFEEYKNWLDAR